MRASEYLAEKRSRKRGDRELQQNKLDMEDAFMRQFGLTRVQAVNATQKFIQFKSRFPDASLSDLKAAYRKAAESG